MMQSVLMTRHESLRARTAARNLALRARFGQLYASRLGPARLAPSAESVIAVLAEEFYLSPQTVRLILREP